MTSFARSIAAERPEEIALRDPRQALTWLDVDNVLNRAANAIRLADTGPDLRIAVFAENGVETARAGEKLCRTSPNESRTKLLCEQTNENRESRSC